MFFVLFSCIVYVFFFLHVAALFLRGGLKRCYKSYSRTVVKYREFQRKSLGKRFPREQSNVILQFRMKFVKWNSGVQHEHRIKFMVKSRLTFPSVGKVQFMLNCSIALTAFHNELQYKNDIVLSGNVFRAFFTQNRVISMGKSNFPDRHDMLIYFNELLIKLEAFFLSHSNID